jgi:hypothetical protein
MERWSVHNPKHVLHILGNLLRLWNIKIFPDISLGIHRSVNQCIANICKYKHDDIPALKETFQEICKRASTAIYCTPSESHTKKASTVSGYRITYYAAIIIITLCIVAICVRAYIPITPKDNSTVPAIPSGNYITAKPYAPTTMYLQADGKWTIPPAFSGASAKSTGAPGYVPMSSPGQQNAYLRGDGNWAVLPGLSNMYLQGDGTWGQLPIFSSAAAGVVPVSTVSKANAYLQGDGNWADMPVFIGASINSAGRSGMVPAPTTAQSYLCGNGTWAGLPGTPEKYLLGDGTWGPPAAFKGATAKTNGIGGAVPVPNSPATYLRGDGTWSVPSVFKGADIGADGTAGIVPAPSQPNSYLCGNGNWVEFSGTGGMYLQGDGTWVQTTFNNPNKVAFGGYIAAILVFFGGVGYVDVPTVTISAPPPGGIQATAFATCTNGVVTSVTLSDMGWGYTDDPVVTLSGSPKQPAHIIAYAMVSGLESYNNSGVTAGGQYSNGYVMQNGDVMMTGYGGDGATGLGHTDNVSTPTPMVWQLHADSAGVQSKPTAAIRLWRSCTTTYVLANDSYLYACGRNENGACGTGGNSNLDILTRTLVPRGVVKFACSYGYADIMPSVAPYMNCIAMLGDGSIWVWGNNGRGELGIGNTTAANKPTYVHVMTAGRVLVPFELVYAASEVYMFGLSDAGGQCYILLKDNTALCTGVNTNGQLSNGSTTTSVSFAFVQTDAGVPLTGIIKIAAAGCGDAATIYYLTASGAVYVSGSNAYGQYGNGSMSTYSPYVQQCLPSGCTDIIAAGGDTTGANTMILAITASGVVIAGSSALFKIQSPAVSWGDIAANYIVYGASGGAGSILLLPDGRILSAGIGSARDIAASSESVTGGWIHTVFSRADVIGISIGGTLGFGNMQILTATGEVYITGGDTYGETGTGMTAPGILSVPAAIIL